MSDSIAIDVVNTLTVHSTTAVYQIVLPPLLFMLEYSSPCKQYVNSMVQQNQYVRPYCRRYCPYYYSTLNNCPYSFSPLNKQFVGQYHPRYCPYSYKYTQQQQYVGLHYPCYSSTVHTLTIRTATAVCQTVLLSLMFIIYT